MPSGAACSCWSEADREWVAAAAAVVYGSTLGERTRRAREDRETKRKEIKATG